MRIIVFFTYLGMVPLAEDISEYLGGAYVLNVQIGDSRSDALK